MTTIDITSATKKAEELYGAELRDQLAARCKEVVAEWPPGETVELTTAGESGSAGKTTASIAFGGLLAENGLTVEIVDLDGQGNASKHVGIGVSERPDDLLLDLNSGYPPLPTMGDVLVQREVYMPGEETKRVVTLDDIRRPAYNPTGIPGYGVILDPEDPNTEHRAEWLSRLSIYPNGNSYASGERRTFYDDENLLAQDPYAPLRLNRNFQNVSTQPHVRIFDLHGTKSATMYSVFLFVERVLSTVGPEDKTTGADLDNLLMTIDEIAKSGVNDKLRLVMILVNRLKAENMRGRIGQMMLERLYERHGDLVPTGIHVRDAVSVTDAYYNREPLNLWVEKDKVTDDFRRALLWALNTGGIFTP
ncbi:ParA family protein [Saccharopolyspora griseoalba]|uniref:ParA family protein n=1 Tax=Saccharopolyspora griseoalba TaxID=1431848 RepID=A0ABW2LTG8_9PSEU